MNSLQFDDYLESLIPKINTDIMNGTSGGSSIYIDYDKLGKSVADHVGKLSDVPGVDVIIDKSGIHVIAKQGLDRTEFLNNKYSIKP